MPVVIHCRMFIPRVHERFYGLELERKCFGKQAMEIARLVNDEENDCRFEWVHKLLTWSIAFREGLLKLFCD